MAIILHDLCGRDDRRFSPNCWRTRLALAHKGLPYEARPVRFIEIPGIAGGRVKTLPTIEDNGTVVTDSWEIACYLEDTYPDTPSLFAGNGGRALTRFTQSWVDTVLHAGLIGLIVHDIHAHLTLEDQTYFRESREKRFGRPLEEMQRGREQRLEQFRDSLRPLRVLLGRQSFLGGDSPLYADYLAVSAFLWARTISPFNLLADDDDLRPWTDRCLDLHGGLARNQPGYYWNTAA